MPSIYTLVNTTLMQGLASAKNSRVVNMERTRKFTTVKLHYFVKRDLGIQGPER